MFFETGSNRAGAARTGDARVAFSLPARKTTIGGGREVPTAKLEFDKLLVEKAGLASPSH